MKKLEAVENARAITWAEDFRRNSGGGCRAAGWGGRWQLWLSGNGGKIDSICHEATPELHVSRGGDCRICAGEHGTAVQTERQEVATESVEHDRTVCAHEFRVTDWSPRAGYTG